ncbi:MAG: hypothetical protein KDC85_11940 [Saprospiraceae bacterium]|nr:hypothetical protein [Saprospiraceae bacterium]MCB9326213.1 hypothetical protein [Lewinellaceae bacterium]
MALYFLLGSAFPNTDFSQITRILNLRDHFNQHKQEKNSQNQPFSFTEFLTSHYTQPNQHQHPNGHCHQNLPLHQLGHSADFVAIHIPAIKSVKIATRLPRHIVDTLMNANDYIQAVFQPPVA